MSPTPTPAPHAPSSSPVCKHASLRGWCQECQRESANRIACEDGEARPYVSVGGHLVPPPEDDEAEPDMTDEDVDAELLAEGVDVDAFVARMRAFVAQTRAAELDAERARFEEEHFLADLGADDVGTGRCRYSPGDGAS